MGNLNQVLDKNFLHIVPGLGAEAMHDQGAKPAQIARLDLGMQHVHMVHSLTGQQLHGHLVALGVQQEPCGLSWQFLLDADDVVATKKFTFADGK